jgi:hypothetical protein
MKPLTNTNPHVALMELEIAYAFLEKELDKYKDISSRNGCKSPEELDQLINTFFWSKAE